MKEISIHAPREGSDRAIADAERKTSQFLSTLPARGATPAQWDRSPTRRHFYPRSPRGERRGQATNNQAAAKFLSTLPARGATACGLQRPAFIEISIHAPREGSDDVLFHLCRHCVNFYPRSPRGERLFPTCCISWCRNNFYPRSPRGERRRPSRHDGQRIRYFYPRSPRGERPCWSADSSQICHFYPRSPRGERPGAVGLSPAVFQTFLSTLPARGATCKRPARWLCSRFLSTLPARGATPGAGGRLRFC